MSKSFHECGFRKNIRNTVKQALEFNGDDILTENGFNRKNIYQYDILFLTGTNFLNL